MQNDTTYHYREDRLYVDEIPLNNIADRLGTPVYVYSLQRILAQWERLNAALAPLNPAFHYSLKANANAHLFRPLIAAGGGCDTVSAGEIYLAIRAGCPPEKIVFAGVGKTDAEIRYALDCGIGWLNVENAGELERLNDLVGARHASPLHKTEAHYPKVALRINPALQADTHRHISTGHEGAKFGIPLKEARALLGNRAAYPNLNIAGLHVHIGSQLGRPDESAAAARIALELAKDFGLTHLNLGGGFPVAYEGQTVPTVETFAAALVPVLAGQGVEIAFEPGRYLIAESGALLAEVLYVKNGGRTVVLDAGMTELIRPALYGARHPIWPLHRSDAQTQPVQVVGPICESSDVLRPEAPLPPLKPGDRIAVGVAGAYGMSMASNYNGRPRPAEVLVEADSWRIIRRRETFEDLARLEAD